MITVIVAHSSNGVIGRAGRIPWHLPSDLRRFKEVTWGHAVVMGRKTFESLPAAVRPLPGRTNIVISRQHEPEAHGWIPAGSPAEALALAGDAEVFVIGGAEIYRQMLPLADRILVTLIEDYIDGDTKFPVEDYSPGDTRFPALRRDWIETDRSLLDFENDLNFRHLTYIRRT